MLLHMQSLKFRHHYTEFQLSCDTLNRYENLFLAEKCYLRIVPNDRKESPFEI